MAGSWDYTAKYTKATTSMSKTVSKTRTIYLWTGSDRHFIIANDGLRATRATPLFNGLPVALAACAA